ncbi:MAG: hypothetical protein IKJ65_10535 [Clostridia bacterium]|nr:hypothetical protein [Clostridia bacterium]
MKKIFLAASLVFSLAVSCVFAPFADAEPIFEAQTPAAASMPDQSDYLTDDGYMDYEAYSEDYRLWANENAAKRDANRLALDEAESLNAYFKDMSKEILAREDQKNKVFSPVNVYFALSMLSEITDGATRDEILQLLNAESVEALRAQANAVFLSVYENDGETTSIPAASVWLRNDIAYKPDALKILCENYFASSFSGEMGSSEYDQMIQKWLSEATGGLLDDAAKKITFDANTMIALATSLYFKAGWENEFSTSLTEENVFHGIIGDQTAEFMKKGGADAYYWGENFGAVALPLTNGGEMWFVLPDEGIAPETLFEDGGIMTLTQNPYDWQDQKRLIVNKSIPKFDVVGENDLIDALKNLGICAAFDAAESDFTPLTDIGEIAVSKAQHDARVKIDEEGIEAAAYTVIMAFATSARPPEDQMDFIVDRPFAFVITSEDNLPLFMGVVNRTDT